MTTDQPATTGLLANKVILVTGAGRGIGAAAAKVFAAEGAALMLASRTESELKATAEEIRERGGTADYTVTDLSSTESVQAVVDATVRANGRLDGAFNNGGASVGIVPMTDVSEAQFDMMVSTNFRSVFFAIRAEVAAILATAGKGAIVNTSSSSAFVGSAGFSAYAAGKRAINSLTETAALEFGPLGIRVNGVAPGGVLTGMSKPLLDAMPGAYESVAGRAPLRRWAEPEEVGEVAAWLLSDRSSYVTGATILVDGGLNLA